MGRAPNTKRETQWPTRGSAAQWPTGGSAIRNTLYFALCICILTTSFATVGCRSGGVRVRSWDEAVTFTQAELEAAGDVAGRLEGYAQTAARLSAEIDLLDQARPALELIGRLRDVEIPLIGDGWQILLALLSTVTIDGARIIGQLEATLRSLTDLKSSLDGLNGLPETAHALRAFRADPSPRSLAALADVSAAATPSMRRLHAQLGEVLEPLRDVADNLGALLSGLRAVAGAGVPVVSDAARRAAGWIGPIEEPLLDLRDGLEQLHHDVRTDAEMLERIQEAARQARAHSE
jgi:hypothetical protein